MDIKCYKVMDDAWEQLKQASADEHINLSITFDNYNIEILDRIYSLHPNTTILINTNDFELTQKNSTKLQQGNEHIKSKYGAQTLFDNGAGLRTQCYCRAFQRCLSLSDVCCQLFYLCRNIGAAC